MPAEHAASSAQQEALTRSAGIIVATQHDKQSAAICAFEDGQNNNNNSNYRVGKTKYKNSFIFIGYGKTNFSFDIGVNLKFLCLLNSYFLNTDKRLYILLKSKRAIDRKVEINFYRKFISCKHTFIKLKSKLSPYKTLDKYENIIFTNLLELIILRGIISLIIIQLLRIKLCLSIHFCKG